MKLLSDLHGSFPDISKKHNKYFFIGKLVGTSNSYRLYDGTKELGFVSTCISSCSSSMGDLHFSYKDNHLFIKAEINDVIYVRRYNSKKITIDDMIKIVISEISSFEEIESLLNLTLIENEYFIRQEVNRSIGRNHDTIHDLYHDDCLLASIFLTNYFGYHIRFRDDSMLIIEGDKYPIVDVELITKNKEYCLISINRVFEWGYHLTMDKVVKLVTNLINIELSIEVIEQFFN